MAAAPSAGAAQAGRAGDVVAVTDVHAVAGPAAVRFAWTLPAAAATSSLVFVQGFGSQPYPTAPGYVNVKGDRQGLGAQLDRHLTAA